MAAPGGSNPRQAARLGEAGESSVRGRFPPLAPQEEAQPYAWPALTEAQRVAATQVFGLLDGIRTLDFRPDHEETEVFDRFMPVIHRQRTNNVILIDGKRGSGKTSLMVTVLQELRRRFEENPLAGGLGFGGTGKVVPVAFLDLHPLPGSASLLLHLVGALEEVVCALEVRPTAGWRGPDEPPWKALAAPSASLARDRWRDLYRAAACSWDGNLEQRAPSLDPEFYAMELGQAERDRRGLSEIFQRFIDALCQEVKEASEKRFGQWAQVQLAKDDYPLFLIAVDDADLAPERSVAVLDLLRKLWHPRVAFLLTGDSDLFLSLLRNHFLGMLLRPLAGIEVPADQWQVQDELARAVVLANSTLERIIPPAHRCCIADLSQQDKLERLREPLQRLVVGPSVAATLEAPGAAGAVSGRPRTLYDYFSCESYASAALPNQLRSLEALKRELEDLEAGKKPFPPQHHSTGPGAGEAGYGPQIALFMAHLWERLLEREPLLGEHRDSLRRVLRINEAGQLVVEAVGLACRVTSRRTRLATHGNWTLGIMSNHVLNVSLTESSPLILSDSLKGAFKVAIDLVADLDSFQFPHGSPTPNGYHFEPVNVKWDRLQQPGMHRGFAWPLPDWEEFLSFSIFAAAWDEKVVKTFPQRCNSADLAHLGQQFLALVIEVARNRTANGGGEGPEPSWAGLAKEVVALVQTSADGTASERERKNSEWALGRAGLLAAPEGGLGPDHANAWLHELKLAFGATAPRSRHGRWRWERVREYLAAERYQQIRQRWHGDDEPTPDTIRSMLDLIDKDSPDHEWRHEVEQPLERSPG